MRTRRLKTQETGSAVPVLRKGKSPREGNLSCIGAKSVQGEKWAVCGAATQRRVSLLAPVVWGEAAVTAIAHHRNESAGA